MISTGLLSRSLGLDVANCQIGRFWRASKTPCQAKRCETDVDFSTLLVAFFFWGGAMLSKKGLLRCMI